MRFPLFHSHNDPRFYLLCGIAFSILLVLVVFAGDAQQVYHTSNQTLLAVAAASAAVVLDATAWSKQPSSVFLEYINHAITLYQSHRVSKIASTGGTPKKGCMTEAEVGRRYTLKRGVPARNILFENTSRNTYENLRNIKPILRASSVDGIIIVSDPYHLVRAQAVAHDLDLDVEIPATPTTHFDVREKKGKFLFQESYLLFLHQFESRGDQIWDWVTRNG